MSSEPSTVNEQLARMAAESASRIEQADAEAHGAQVAFAAGEFEPYFHGKLETVTNRIQASAQGVLDEYKKIFGPPAVGGDSETDG